jgi:hypothetical protein
MLCVYGEYNIRKNYFTTLNMIQLIEKRVGYFNFNVKLCLYRLRE